MKTLLLLMVMVMIEPVLAETQDWERFNSSLLIEVTRAKGIFTCTGVAVSSEVVLTAGHCLEGDVKKVRVFTQAQYDPKQTSLEITSFKIHPTYNSAKSRYFSDLAKIVMKEKLPPFVTIHPIEKSTKIMGQIYRFGFGAREKKNLRTVITPTLRRVNLDEEVLELNDEYSRSGDSGGPVFLQNGQTISVLAIHSTFSHGPQGNFSLNPLLSAYVPWIFSN